MKKSKTKGSENNKEIKDKEWNKILGEIDGEFFSVNLKVTTSKQCLHTVRHNIKRKEYMPNRDSSKKHKCKEIYQRNI